MDTRKLILILLLNCYYISTYGYHLQMPPLSSSSISTESPSSLISFQPESHKNFINPRSHHEYSNLLQNQQNIPQQHQQITSQKLLEQSPEQKVSFDSETDCVQQKQQLRTTASSITNSPLDSTTMDNAAQQLEQFIFSLKPQNMTDISPTTTQQQLNDKISTDDMLGQEIEVDLLNKKQQSQNYERFEHEQHFDQGIKGGSQASHDEPQRFKAAVLTRYSMEYRPIDSNMLLEHEEVPQEQIIEVIPRSRPLQIHFKSPTNQIKVLQTPIERQQHSEPEIERSEDEPRMYFHQIKKPIIQEVHEIIMPYRKVIQEIQPVVEQVHTVVSSTSASGPPAPGKQRITNNKKFNSNSKVANKFNIISPIKRQQERELLEQKHESEDSTLSPLLMGVEQQVEPQQLQQTSEPLSPSPPSTSSLVQQQRRVRKFIKVMPPLIAPAQLHLMNGDKDERKYFNHMRIPLSSSISSTSTSASKVAVNLHNVRGQMSGLMKS